MADTALSLCRRHRHPELPWMDVGCGTGELVRGLAGPGFPPVIGADRDAAMLEVAAEDMAPGGGLLRCDARRLPVADGALGGLSAVSFTGTLERPAEFFAEAARVLGPGGVLVVSFTNAQAFGVRRFDARRGARPVAPQRQGRYRRYRLDEARGLLGGAGLGVVETRFTSAFVESGGRLFPSLRMARRLPALLPGPLRVRWCANFVLVARA